MGVSFSCPIAAYNDVESDLDSLLQESVHSAVRSVSFIGQEHHILKSPDNGEMVVQGSMASIWRELKRIILDKDAPSNRETSGSNLPISRTSEDTECYSYCSDSSVEMVRDLPVLDTTLSPHDAATKLQKVYRSFRTRRKLADCAVLVEQSWWKLLDFAELKHSSISFFEIEKHESAISRWSRAKKRAAKVGKGLSKNSKAQKLALQHWLEAIDPRHRYGHNLHFYYKKWLVSQSTQPFFYWLDIGEGKELNLERCPRSKLQQQCIKYLGPMERKAYEVILKDGKFFHKQTGELLHSAGEKKDKWIFVLSTSKILYVGKKRKGYFQHSSFLSGGASICAGRVVVENGILKAIWPHSGHYQPTEENFRDFQAFLRENNVDLTDVKMSPTEEDEASPNKQSSGSVESSLSVEELSDKLIGSEPEDNNVESSIPEKNNSKEQNDIAATEPPISKLSHSLGKKLTRLEIPKPNELVEESQAESPMANVRESEDVVVPKESILKRINSHKGMKSFQLGTQLSCKWTSGAGPRIGCVRDYPSQLQYLALEQLNLSARTARRSKSFPSCQSIIESSSEVSSPTNPVTKLQS